MARYDEKFLMVNIKDLAYVIAKRQILSETENEKFFLSAPSIFYDINENKQHLIILLSLYKSVQRNNLLDILNEQVENCAQLITKTDLPLNDKFNYEKFKKSFLTEYADCLVQSACYNCLKSASENESFTELTNQEKDLFFENTSSVKEISYFYYLILKNLDSKLKTEIIRQTENSLYLNKFNLNKAYIDRNYANYLKLNDENFCLAMSKLIQKGVKPKKDLVL